MDVGEKWIDKGVYWETNQFPIAIRLRHSTLSPYFVVLAMDELTRHIQDNVPWGMLLANDIILVDETVREVNVKLEFSLFFTIAKQIIFLPACNTTISSFTDILHNKIISNS